MFCFLEEERRLTRKLQAKTSRPLVSYKKNRGSYKKNDNRYNVHQKLVRVANKG